MIQKYYALKAKLYLKIRHANFQRVSNAQEHETWVSKWKNERRWSLLTHKTSLVFMGYLVLFAYNEL